MNSQSRSGLFKVAACIFLFYPLFFEQSFGVRFLLRLSFISASCLLILIHNTPCLERRFIPYGLSGPRPGENKGGAYDKRQREPPGLLDAGLNHLSAIRVPHSWFRHFYVISVVSSIFWAYQLLTNGPAYTWIANLAGEGESNVPLYRVSILWLLMFAQGCRRLYESFAYDKESKSQMWVGHWIMGIGFYLAVNVALWIDATRTVFLWHHVDSESVHPVSHMSMVDGRQIPTIALFTVYSVAQNNIHRFLATLPSKSHQLPSQGLFPGTLCPHYGYEVFLYAVLAFGWGMEGSTPTMDAVLRFVAVNLFISARQKQKWYREQFGAAAIKDRTLMFTSRWFETVETALGSLIPEL